MNMRFILVTCTVIFLFQNTVLANKKLAEQYVILYKDVAISEMYRVGIPASIKLAQGMLESTWGQSDLALRANNHFGIKCGGNWQGGRYFKVDDDTDDSGQSVESCFRKFDSAEESYFEHSSFLTNANKKARYGFLFQYPTTDYVSWAKGLQFSGYATDKKYADKLISIIEMYKLYQYDVMLSPSATEGELMVHETTKSSSKRSDEQPVLKNAEFLTKPESDKNSVATKKLRKRINGLPCIIAEKGETIEEVSKRTRVNKHDIVIYNESKYYLDTPLKEGQIIFLEGKKRFNEEYSFHVVKESETLFDVAQKYGIKISSLASRNKIPEHARVTKGLKLYINQPGMDHSHLREELVTEEFIDFGNIK